jgi:hypothetical protein
MTVVAHVGHWLVNVLYALPIVALLVVLIWDRIKHRGKDPDAELAPDGEGVD